MPTENYIKQKAKEIFEQNKWLWYFPPRTRYQREDIFGFGDCLLWTKRGLKLIQLTTSANSSTRKKKIVKILLSTNYTCPIALWSWHTKKKEFIKEEILK